jgi:hypothetical protein
VGGSSCGKADSYTVHDYSERGIELIELVLIHTRGTRRHTEFSADRNVKPEARKTRQLADKTTRVQSGHLMKPQQFSALSYARISRHFATCGELLVQTLFSLDPFSQLVLITGPLPFLCSSLASSLDYVIDLAASVLCANT